MSSIEELLRRVEVAMGDTQSQAAMAAEFLVMARPESEREPLRSALDAAAVLRWFNAELLAEVLGVVTEEGQKHFDKLKSLPFWKSIRHARKPATSNNPLDSAGANNSRTMQRRLFVPCPLALRHASPMTIRP